MFLYCPYRPEQLLARSLLPSISVSKLANVTLYLPAMVAESSDFLHRRQNASLIPSNNFMFFKDMKDGRSSKDWGKPKCAISKKSVNPIGNQARDKKRDVKSYHVKRWKYINILCGWFDFLTYHEFEKQAIHPICSRRLHFCWKLLIEGCPCREGICLCCLDSLSLHRAQHCHLSYLPY